MMPTRAQAEELFLKYNDSESLYTHGKQVECAMRYFAEREGEDPEKWSIIGFLHDLDYGKYPDQHCEMTEKILREEGYPEDMIRAILCHGYGMVTDIKPESTLEKYLFAADELTGLINAACLMRPSKSVLDFSVSSLKKKWKDKKFAAGVDRDVILKGCEMLGIEKEQLMEETIAALQKYAEEARLKGEL